MKKNGKIRIIPTFTFFFLLRKTQNKCSIEICSSTKLYLVYKGTKYYNEHIKNRFFFFFVQIVKFVGREGRSSFERT